jgi:L-threonylcarbamoyladenylate synthase
MRVLASDAPGIRVAAAWLRRGELVAFPTETVYGLGAVATWADACRRIYVVKGRPADNPLIWHFADWTDVQAYVRLTELARALFQRYAPGPLTVVSLRRDGPGTIACRVPGHALARALVAETGFPLAAPSANRSGRPSPTTAQHVERDFPTGVAAVLDGGPTGIGIESTVVDATGDEVHILRPGAVTEEMLRRDGFPLAVCDGGALLQRSPGTRHAHYRPAVPLIALVGRDEALAARWVAAQSGRVAVLAPFPVPGDGPRLVYRSTAELSRRLYAALRAFEEEADVILVLGPEQSELGRALWNRLERAAAGRVYDESATPVDALGERPSALPAEAGRASPRRGDRT